MSHDEGAPPNEADSEPATPKNGSVMRIFLILSVLAGIGAGAATVRFSTHYGYPAEVQPWLDASGLSPEQTIRMAEVEREMLVKNTTLCGAAVGLVLAVACGFAGGLGGGSFGKAILGALVGAILGAGLGLVGGRAGVGLWAYLKDQGTDVTYLAVFANAVLWSFVGLASGIAAGVGKGSFTKIAGAAVAGVAGGLLSAVIFFVVASIALPDVSTVLPLPDAPASPSAAAVAKYVWASVSALLIGLLLSVAVTSQPKAKAKTESAGE